MANDVRIIIKGKDESGKAFASAEGRGHKFKGFMAGVGKVAGGVLGAQFVAGAGRKVLDFFDTTTDAASDLNESLNKSNVIFGRNAKSVAQWASGGAKNFGLSKQAALDYAGSLGNMFNQLGFGAKQTVQMSKGIVELAADFASFHNADITEVLEAQQAAFRGEYDSLQRFIPTISAATVEQEALKETGKKTTKELTAQDKALAVNTIMHEKAGKAVGDFARTSDDFANSQRIAAAEIENTNAKIGAKLLPLKAKFTEWKLAVVGALASVADWISGHANDFQLGFIIFAQGAVKSAKIILPVLKIIVENFLDTVGAIVTGAAKAFGWVPKLGDKLRTAAKSFQDFRSDTRSALDGAIDKVNQWDRDTDRMRKKIQLKGDIQDLKAELANARHELKRPDLNRARTARILGNIHDLSSAIRRAKRQLAGIDGAAADVYIRGHVQGVPAQFGGRAFLEHGGISGAAAGGPRGRWTMVGEHGRELINLAPGSTVRSNPDTERMLGRRDADRVVLELRSSGTRLDDLLLELLRKSIRVRGGNVQFVLGDSRQVA